MNVDPEISAIYEQLRGRVRKAVEANIAPDETVRAIVRGGNGQAIVGTDRRAFVCKPGWMAGATLGAEVTTYNYLNVSGVQMHTGMMSGTVAIETGQQMKKTSIWGQGDADTLKAPNAIPLSRPWDEARDAVARLRQAIDQSHSSMISTSNSKPEAVQASSIADELAKLADLRTSGVLSEDEFAAAKRSLLSV